uniref:Bm1431 n=1 Tax=Brugia malayi TaxID=6279 RepID=A0A1I9GDF0_BRUMA|nr:Bm1431 [Brugia malayi]
MSSAMYDESVPGVVYVMRRKTEAVLVTPNTIITDTLKHAQNEKFLSNFIYSTSFPYVLYNDSKGASVLSLENPSDEAAYILHSEIEAIEERRNDTVAVTKAVAKQDFEKAAFGIESEIIERPEFHTQKCRLVNAPFFMAFILKVSVLDMLLLLILIILVIYHRAHIIPARRRYKIKMGILKHRKKRKLRDRARRRLRKLNLLRRRKKIVEQETEAKRQAKLIAAAVGQLGGAAASTTEKKKSSSSSSDLITAGAERNVQVNVTSNLQGEEADEHAKALATLSLTQTYLISGVMLLSCCILPLLYFWFCHPMSKSMKLGLEETQADEIELMEFVPDEAPDRVNIRCDPFFDDVKVKAFHRRHHHLLRPPRRRQQQQEQNARKVSPVNKISEKGKETNEDTSNVQKEKVSNTPENSVHRSGAEQLTSTEITFSHQTQLHAL